MGKILFSFFFIWKAKNETETGVYFKYVQNKNSERASKKSKEKGKKISFDHMPKVLEKENWEKKKIDRNNF